LLTNQSDHSTVFSNRVIPYADYLALTGQGNAEDVIIPHELVGLAIKNGWNLAKTWRKYSGISQKELARTT
jgi:hypothetical protein